MENKDIGIFGQFIKSFYQAVLLPYVFFTYYNFLISSIWNLGVMSVMVKAYSVNYSVFSALFPLKLRVVQECLLYQYKKILYLHFISHIHR